MSLLRNFKCLFCVEFFGDFEAKSLTEKCPRDFGELTILSYTCSGLY